MTNWLLLNPHFIRRSSKISKDTEAIQDQSKNLTRPVKITKNFMVSAESIAKIIKRCKETKNMRALFWVKSIQNL